MSNISKSSRTSLKSYGKQGTRKKRDGKNSLLKPYDFCCDINNQDDETRYNKQKPIFSSSLTMLSPIQESPALKIRYESIEPVVNTNKKFTKGKSKPQDWDSDSNPCVKTRGPLLWFQEDEIELTKDQFWSQKQKIFNIKADRNALIGEKKVKKLLASSISTAGPRWYQDLSIPQMKQVLSLGVTMTADYEETTTVRTQQALSVIGVTSTFFKVAPRVIKKLQRSTKLQPIQFLGEIYKMLSGQYFVEEEYKKIYDCNERIILSAIAFLALPDAVIELNKRLPQISDPKFPPKPKPPRNLSTRQGFYKWPYDEPLFQPPDWVTYRKSLDEWREMCKLVPRPRVIHPQLKKNKVEDSRKFEDMKSAKVQIDERIVSDKNKTNSLDLQRYKNEQRLETKIDQNENNAGKPLFDFLIPNLTDGDKQTFQFSISGLGEKPGPIDYKICGTLKPPFPKRKSWLGEKEAHYIVSGISEHEDPPQCPVTYVMTGISCVTPHNSDEEFFAELRLGDGPKRFYPSGRKNLSKNWQEWLQDADEEFLEVEREANKLIKSVEATMRLVIPGDRCDACCSCRQTRKTNLKVHATKTPYMVIDSITETDDQNKYIVGSLAMHSPAPSPVESTVNLLEVVASKETFEKKLVINGITNDKGEITYYISGVTEDKQYIPKRTISIQRPPKPLRNVPPCACTIERMFNQGDTKVQIESSDDIPQTKKKGICFGNKYRPKESAAYTCKEYPDDKSCRRNPFKNKIKRRMSVKTNDCSDDENNGAPQEKKMFTLPAFSPCGDEDGMAICGGPWGAKNIPIPKVIESTLAAKNPSIKIGKTDEEDGEGENEEDEGDEKGREKKLTARELAKIAKEVEAEERKLKKQQLKRDKLCSERFEDEVTDTKKPTVMDELAINCDSDNPWNRIRTAPTVNPWENEYEKSLKLTQAVVSSNSHKVDNEGLHKKRGSSSKRKKKENGLSSSDDNRNVKEDKNKTRNDKDIVQVIYSGKQVARDPNPIGRHHSDAKSRRVLTENKQVPLASDNKVKNSRINTPKGQGTLQTQDVGVKNNKEKLLIRKKPINKKKSAYKSERENGRRNRLLSKNDCGNNTDKKSLRDSVTQRKKLQRHKQDEVNRKKIKTKTSTQQVQVSPKKDKIFKVNRVAPAVIPDEVRLPCQREKTIFNKESDNCECSDEEGINPDAHNGKDGPKFGWRTKSQQELPREKTLVYLAEPNDPVEMIKVREGGKPCNCRENRNNKKILLYNIGGAVNVGKSGKGSDYPQVIEGVTYLTPPQSPRNSSEYIPEYELFESPYKMCERQRSDKDLKYITELSTIRSLSPGKKTNVESCACGYEIEANTDKDLISTKRMSSPTSRENRLSSALKNEGLIDYFTSCHDGVPCWLKCAKFSKAGCCEKPKLLQVKKPVCECRYERRVVRREEEKQKWMDRQRRLKAAKKQPHLEVSGTSRPMTQDTKLIISSVKKVLRDGEFIPETQYCVSGIAENYAMGPPQYVIPGISMQSPIVTPEPSKPDILCMCGHRHWSPTDITAAGRRDVNQSLSTRAKGEYPCRGREQQKKIVREDVSNPYGEKIKANDSEAYEAYRSCSDAVQSCNTVFNGTRQFEGRKKRKLLSSVNNERGNLKKSKFNADKVFKDTNNNREKQSAKAGDGTRLVNEQIMEINTEGYKSAGRDKPVATNDSSQNASSSENVTELSELMKIELEKMANEDFILAKLPECWLIPQLKSWIEYREGKVYSDSLKNELCRLTRKRWDIMQQTRRPSVPLPSLHLRPAEAARMTYDRVNEIKKKISAAQAKYFSEIRKRRVSESRSYWPTMEFGKFPSLGFKDAYFTYMAGKEADGHVFRPWKMSDSKQ